MMLHRLRTLSIGLAAALATAASLAAGGAKDAPGKPAAPPGERSCFLPRQVDGFHAIDRDTVDVTIGPRRIYRLELVGTCPDIDWSTRIGIRSTHGGSWICQGNDAELLVPGPAGTDRCLVTGVRRLSEAEVDALRASRRKK